MPRGVSNDTLKFVLDDELVETGVHCNVTGILLLVKPSLFQRYKLKLWEVAKMQRKSDVTIHLQVAIRKGIESTRLTM